MTSFIDEYHKLYEGSKIWSKNSFMGIPCWKLPLDLMVIQELIYKTKPEFIIETGTGHGGSALFYASLCELMGQGQVITIDINMSKKDSNKWGMFEWEDRIEFIYGGSVNSNVVDRIENLVKDFNCMVILDSWHTEEHVYEEMNIYSKFVPVNGYMVVEDTHAGNPGNPIQWKYDDKGPSAAVEKFLEENKGKWVVDYECEKHLMSFNMGGYLRRIK